MSEVKDNTEKENKDDGSVMQKKGDSDKTKKYDDERSKRMLERKLRSINNTDSIFILPFAREGFKMAHMARIADKYMSYIKRNFGIRIDIKKSKEIFTDFETFAQQLWEFVYKIAPNLYSMSSREWRKINDLKEEKTALAHRRSTIVIEPRSEESAQIAMAVKIIQQRNIELRQSASFTDLEKFVKEYAKLLENFDTLLVSVAKDIQQDYESFFKDSN